MPIRTSAPVRARPHRPARVLVLLLEFAVMVTLAYTLGVGVHPMLEALPTVGQFAVGVALASVVVFGVHGTARVVTRR